MCDARNLILILDLLNANPPPDYMSKNTIVDEIVYWATDHNAQILVLYI